MFAKTVLDNGIRVVSHEMQDHRSVSLGIWVENGSRHESEAENGISHFIEHLLFKGTERRSAAQVAEEMDAVGGVINIVLRPGVDSEATEVALTYTNAIADYDAPQTSASILHSRALLSGKLRVRFNTSVRPMWTATALDPDPGASRRFSRRPSCVTASCCKSFR